MLCLLPRFRVLPLWLLCFSLVPSLFAADRGAEARAFDLVAGPAEKTLKSFSEQAGRSLILATQVTTGVETRAVQGRLLPRDALAKMLEGTGLIGIEDPKSGAFTVRREKEKERGNVVAR